MGEMQKPDRYRLLWSKLCNICQKYESEWFKKAVEFTKNLPIFFVHP